MLENTSTKHSKYVDINDVAHDDNVLQTHVVPCVDNHRLVMCLSLYIFLFRFMVFNITSNNISVIALWSVLLVEETGENHRPVAGH